MTTITTTQPRRASAAERARVHRWVEKWQREYYLTLIVVSVIFHDYPDDDEGNVDDEPTCAARMDGDLVEKYHTATLQIFPKFFDDGPEEQEFMIAHEMMHIILWPLSFLVHRLQNGILVTPQELAERDERVVDHVARIAFFGGSRPKVWKKIAVKSKARAKKKRTLKPSAGKSKVSAKAARDAARKDRKK